MGITIGEFVIVPEISCPKAEKAMLTNQDFLSFWKANPNAQLYELLDPFFTQAEICEMEAEAHLAVRDCFKQLKDGETANVVGHNPYIALAGNRNIGKRHFGNMKEMEFLDFEMDEAGNITVVIP